MAPKTNTSGSHAGPLEATSFRRSDSNRTCSRKSGSLAGVKGRVVVLISDPRQKNWYTCRRVQRSNLLRCPRGRHLVAIGQGLQEGDEGIFFLVGQLKVAELAFVEVGWVLWLRPAGDLFAGVAWLALGQDVPRVINMHDLFQAFEVAVVHVVLDEGWHGTHVDVAQSGYLELGVELGRELDPRRIGIELAAIALQRAQKGSDSPIDVCRSSDVRSDVGSVAALVGPTLVIELQSRIFGDAEITCGKVCKQGLFPGPAVAMTLVASRLAAEELITQFFLRRELVVSCLHVVVLRREGTHFWRELICGNGQPELVIYVIGAKSVCRTQVERELIILRRRPWSRANFFRIARPLHGKRVRAPHGLKELAIGSVGEAVRNTGRIGQTHFHGIGRRSLRLFGAWILQAVAARAHVPEIATHEVALERVVVEHRREGRVHIALRLSIAETRSD